MTTLGKILKKYAAPLLMLAIFEAVAVMLWLAKGELFYLLNFTYIGCSIALGLVLYILRVSCARRVVQLLVGLYMLVYLGLICHENMQIEGFWYYLFQGSFTAATIHYAVAKLFWSAAVWPRVVRLRLLDGHGTGSAAL